MNWRKHNLYLQELVIGDYAISITAVEFDVNLRSIRRQISLQKQNKWINNNKDSFPYVSILFKAMTSSGGLR